MYRQETGSLHTPTRGCVPGRQAGRRCMLPAESTPGCHTHLVCHWLLLLSPSTPFIRALSNINTRSQAKCTQSLNARHYHISIKSDMKHSVVQSPRTVCFQIKPFDFFLFDSKMCILRQTIKHVFVFPVAWSRDVAAQWLQPSRLHCLLPF